MFALTAFLVAAAPVSMGYDSDVVGWAKDGSAFVWQFRDSAYEPKPGVENPESDGDMMQTEAAIIAVVCDPVTANTSQYVLSLKQLNRHAKGTLTSRYAQTERSQGYNAWKKSVGGVLARAADSPTGARAETLIDAAPASNWTADGAHELVMRTVKGAGTIEDSYGDGSEAMYTAERSIEVWWDPTGRFAAFVVWTAPGQTMRGEAPAKGTVFFVLVPPRLELVSSERLATQRAELSRKLTDANYVVLREGPSQKDRTTTVLYAAAGFEGDAKKLAKLIPGATVDRLTWKADADVVVALGAPEK